MDLKTFESFVDNFWALPTKSDRLAVEEKSDPRSIQVVVRHATLPTVFHYVIVFPAKVDGMVIRKWWTHDQDVGIETPLQGIASPTMVLQQIQQLMAA
ncbi:MAG: hypothetical protein ABJB74_04005 [Gemmatimonas sp.]